MRPDFQPAPTKIALGEMRASGVREVLVYCRDDRCSHSVEISADRWADDLRPSAHTNQKKVVVNFADLASPLEGWMTIAKEDLRAVLTCLAERFPRTFVLDGYQPHRPLKVGIAADLAARCPELNRRKLGAVLSAYTQRIMYRKAMVAGAARVDLDGNPAGEVSALDAEHAAARLAETLASRQARRDTTVAARSAERTARHPAVPAPPAATPPVARTLKDKPVLRLPAFRQ